MIDNYEQYPPRHFGTDEASGADESHVLTIDDLPKHDNGYKSFDMTKFLSDSDYGSTPPEKHWYESKVIWFNAIVIAVGLATSATPALEQYMSAEMYGVIATFVAFINAVLRLVTGQPIKSGGV
ncbi:MULTISPECIES: hypothetical protein [unclassified Psychrobacter]|uniref:hypothetical protein n=1 Tax=unclassified Psychrobacter TaxID=196806 RepID=UPI0008A6ACF5|nr:MULTISPECIES: hypothetical protein [unclassified Psychrobacter]AOY43451.1 hypothetical protein AOT82_1072 [Psychrobacter sp. AntiMn-1]BBI66834.1 hypothetical protein PKHYL_10250 [Psychrobacter sp. KH172YL61]